MKTIKEKFVEMFGEFYETNEYPDYTKPFENLQLIRNREPYIQDKTYIEIFDEVSKKRFLLGNLDENMNLNIDIDKVMEEYKKNYDIKERMPSLYRIIEKLQLQDKLGDSLKCNAVKSTKTKI